MSYLKIEIREYPKDKQIEIDELTKNGAMSMIHDCEELIVKLKDFYEVEE